MLVAGAAAAAAGAGDELASPAPVFDSVLASFAVAPSEEGVPAASAVLAAPFPA